MKLGDWVHLKSGSPLMLVVDVDSDTITVAWDNGRQEAQFPSACLAVLPKT